MSPSKQNQPSTRFFYHFSIWCALFFIFWGGSVSAAGDNALPQKLLDKKPLNFIVILLDDLGLHDVGFMGNGFIETPAMDALAKRGVVFTQAYANAPNCAPSRAAIVSGQYAPRTGVYTMATGDMGAAAQRKLLTPKNNMFLPEQVYTLAELLRDHGYATASIGKWNLGHGAVRGPEGQGFDVNIAGHRGGVGQSYFAPYSQVLPNLSKSAAGEYLTDRLNDEAIRFVDQHSERSFFLYLSHYAPHFPIQAPQQTVKKYQQKRRRQCEQDKQLRYCAMSDFYPEYAAMVEHVDRGLARLYEHLEAEGIDKNTVIVLMSDNGGYRLVSDPDNLRGQKSQLYEGGIRVPMLWYVPGNRAGVVDAPVAGIDIYPTIAALAGIDVSKQTLDGRDISSLFFQQTAALPARDLFWYLPGYTLDSEMDETDSVAAKSTAVFSQIPAVAMRRGDWKLIWYYDGTPSELYNLRADPKETHNRAQSEAAIVKTMTEAVRAWLLGVGGVTQLPRNPSYKK